MSDFTDFLERANDPNPYDAAINADAQRSLDYKRFIRMCKQWDEEANYLQTTRRRCDTDEEFDDVDYLIQQIPVKKYTVSLRYTEKYSRFKPLDYVQVVENNRVQYVGQIRAIRIAVSYGEAELYRARARQKPNLVRVGDYENIRYFTEDEFAYIVYDRNVNYHAPPYRIASPCHIIVKPRTMYLKCPLCDVENKPLMDTVIGGEEKIICVDCDSTLNDLFGVEYVKNMMKFNDIRTLPAYEKICTISELR